jgi:hypothetical protein
MNIGKLSLILGIVCIVSFTISIALGPILLFEGFESQSINQFQNFSSNGINQLNTNLLDSEIVMHPIEGNNFEFKLTGSYAKNNYNNTINFSAKKYGDSLDVKITYPQKIVVINRHLTLDMGIPENYSGNINLKTASGSINVKDLNVNSFEAVSSSGNIYVENINSENSFLSSVSGNIKSFNVSSKNIKVESTSGRIEIDKSGKLERVKSTSGNIRIYNYGYDGDLFIETVSGNVDLNLERDYSAKVIFKSNSGNFDNLYGDISNGKNIINVKTTSGNFDLN